MNRVEAIPTDKIVPLLKACLSCGDKYYVMLLIGITTGLRISDILNLKVNSFMTSSSPMGAPVNVVEKKTGKRKSFTLDKSVQKTLNSYIRNNSLFQDSFLIYSSVKNKDKPLTRSRAYAVLSKAAFSIGLNNIGTHSMRKTYAKIKYNQEGNIQSVMASLNHDYVSTTLLYLIDDFSKIKL